MENQDQNQNQNLTDVLVSSSVSNMSSTFHVLPSCAGCLALNINYTVRNLDQALKLVKIDLETGPAEITAQSVYLLGRTEALVQTLAPCASCA